MCWVETADRLRRWWCLESEGCRGVTVTATTTISYRTDRRQQPPNQPPNPTGPATGPATGTVIASEPDSDDPGWRELADLTAVHLTGDGLTETTL